MTKRKKIALIFATGTVLSSLKSRSIVFVDNESDIPKWLEAIPEIGLIAEIQPHFLLSESETFGYVHTLELSKKIHDLSQQVDGVVVLMRTESIIAQAVLLNFLNQNTKIPVIFTGAVVSPQALTEGVLSDAFKKNVALSLKSNAINAIQVAARDFHGFGIMYGNRLIEPVRARRENVESLNIFSSADNKYVGRVEFGISINQGKITTQPERHYNQFSSNITVIDSAILNVAYLKQLTTDAIIVKMRENERLSTAVTEALRHLKQPVILYNYWYVLEHPGLITVSRITDASVLAKVMWLIAERTSASAFKQGMQENVIGKDSLVSSLFSIAIVRSTYNAFPIPHKRPKSIVSRSKDISSLKNTKLNIEATVKPRTE
jgi:L-asparaginase/Glu-tRNA(Gln) amidotransferase subunit D